MSIASVVRNLCSMIEKTTGMRKTSLVKSMCCVFFVYILAILILSILYLNNKMEAKVFTHELIPFTQDSDNNNTLLYIDDWKRVSDKVYVYSAFWEYRTNPTMVRIIGIGLRLQNYTSKLICLLKYAETTISVTPATSSNLEDNHDMTLSAKFFYCKAEAKPEKVALISIGSKCISWLQVHDTNPGKNVSKNNIALCTQPLYTNYAKSLTDFNIAEFLAYYEILGVSKFVFYDYKADDDVKSFLNRFSSVEVLPWTFPKEAWYIWNIGQIASVVNCVYKHASSYEYIAIIDLDEYIVPSAYITLQTLLQEAIKTNGSNWSSYMFRHTFFCLDYSDDPMAQNITLPFITQIKTERGKIWDPYARAKSIIRPSAVVMPGIHYTWETLRNWNASLDINPSIALLHHYRKDLCRFDEKERVIDRTAWKYRRALLESKAIRIWRDM